jgi:hypothetical protein
MRTSRLTLAVGVVLLVVFALPLAGQRSNRASLTLRGAWKVVERTTTGPNGSLNRTPQPGLWIFTDGYFSSVTVTSAQPRPDLPDAAKATADELRAVWGPLVAQAGTYDTAGDILTFRYVVNKNPGGMKPGSFQAWVYKLEGNTLMAIQKNTENGPNANPATLQLVRVE